MKIPDWVISFSSIVMIGVLLFMVCVLVRPHIEKYYVSVGGGKIEWKQYSK